MIATATNGIAIMTDAVQALGPAKHNYSDGSGKRILSIYKSPDIAGDTPEQCFFVS
jgi:hypothetical protein